MKSPLLVAVALMLFSAPAFGADGDLEFMLVGKEVMEIADTWQLTQSAHGNATACSISPDGKQVAFVAAVKDKWSLCLVASIGGSAKTLMKSDDDLGSYRGTQETSWSLSGYNPAWTPDGRYILLTATAHTVNEHSESRQCCLVVLTAKGEFVLLIPVPEQGYVVSELMLTPDGSRAAAVSRACPEGPNGRDESTLTVFDLAHGTARNLIASSCFFSQRFSPDGGSLYYYAVDRGAKPTQIVQYDLNLQTGDRREIESFGTGSGYPAVSPDGSLLALGDKPTISVRNEKSGQSAVVIKSRSDGWLLWAPNSRWFVYREFRKLKDHTGSRKKNETIYWLACPETHNLNTLPIATAEDEEMSPFCSWSADSLKVAYISKGRVHVVALRKRPPTPGEKVQAGLALTEQELLQYLPEKLHEVGTAIFTYIEDNEGVVPEADSIEDQIRNYLRGRNIIFSQSLAQGFFRYFPENLANIRDEDRCRTIMAEFDYGYDWKAVVYADCHTQIVKK